MTAIDQKLTFPCLLEHSITIYRSTIHESLPLEENAIAANASKHLALALTQFGNVLRKKLSSQNNTKIHTAFVYRNRLSGTCSNQKYTFKKKRQFSH